MSDTTSTIIWTDIDEAPALATYSFLPIVQAFTKGTGVSVEKRDISLAGRIIASFPEHLTDAQRIPDYLSQLGALTLKPEANIIKLPNVSASIPQLKEAIRELQGKGYNVPDYPEAPKDDAEKAIQSRYAKVLGSAVNPVLREGNSDRRPPLSVKAFSKKHPHKLGAWSADSRSHVAHMTSGDFYGSENSTTLSKAAEVRYEFVAAGGGVTVLKKSMPLLDGEILDTAVMHVGALRRFFEEQIDEAKASGLLLSLHLKATMMKVSDPVMFGHAVSVFFKDVFEKHAATFKELGVNPNNGLGDLYAKIQGLPAQKKAEIEADIKAVYAARPPLAMVDSDKGITNLHVPSDIIVDASMPVVVRESRQDVGPRRQAARHEGPHSRSLLRHGLQDDHRGLQAARRPRPGDDGFGAERGADGPESRGIRVARQDVHRPGGGHDSRRRRIDRGDAPPAAGGRGATSSVPARPRTSPSATG